MAAHTFTDQMNRQVKIPENPARIISLVPSQTELLFDLGLDKEICGITRYCIHPAGKVAGIEKIGGTKQFDIEKIKRLQPDLIIGNKEENYEEGIAELEKHFPVWMSDIYTLEDSVSMIQQVGLLVNRTEKAMQLCNEITTGFNEFSSKLQGKKAAYFIWRKPYMVAANHTFINQMLAKLGVANAFEKMGRYPEVTLRQLADTNPDFIFLSSEPYRFTTKHYEEFSAACPTAKVLLVDGELFSWYGSRLRHTTAYFKQLQKQLTSPADTPLV